MARPFQFGETAKKQARLRQFGLCAVCGHSLRDLFEHAHHVVPNQSGDPADESHLWLKSELNCVILCELCHEVVHESGHYRYGAVAPPEYFRYSHAKDAVAHQRWAGALTEKMKQLWGPTQPARGARRSSRQ
jgi:hypothetical protein